MNRTDFQRLAKERVRDAKALLAAGRWSCAYYVAGYAVENALKSCVIVYLMKTDKFPDKTFSQQCWTHDLKKLLDLAGLKPAHAADTAADPDLSGKWGLVEEWSEASRYERKSRLRARQLYEAITDKKHGVLRWIKSRW